MRMWLERIFGRKGSARSAAPPGMGYPVAAAPASRPGFAEVIGLDDLPRPRNLLRSGEAGASTGSRRARAAEPEADDLPFASTGPQGHRGRMREKLLERGPDALADYELLEMLLFFASKKGDTKPIAKSLINRYGSLAAVLTAP
ncbi:hypothetical protein ACFQX4_16230 [Roseomonas sp. GCM10028921]